jgi:hypothetical protein
MSTNVLNILTILGKIDGGIAAAAASWGLYDPDHIKIAICIAGVAGGIGMILNAISHAFGGGNVEKVVPATSILPPPPISKSKLVP